MGAIMKNGTLYGGCPEIQTAAGTHINDVGTPTVSTSTSQGVTTFTFDYLKGASGASSAGGVSYNNTSSGLTADDVQEAIDELNTEKISGDGKIESFAVVNGVLRVYYEEEV